MSCQYLFLKNFKFSDLISYFTYHNFITIATHLHLYIKVISN